jgi:inner membrane protein
MPSAFSHAISAVALSSGFNKSDNRTQIIILGMICSVLPDADVISFQFGIPYSSMFGHRGITHSFFFALILSLVIMFSFYRKHGINKSTTILFSYFFLATALHPLLDACTDGGLGVAFLAPFNNSRYFFPFRPIEVSPISISGFFTSRGLEVFKSELLWVWAPSLLIILFNTVGRKKRTI